uniref:Nucleotidyltransferase domain-containing protein n=1 Tax=Candidatus Desulfatibia profunda TaxID=2841695 RepID=A0A8J6NUP7_9BACT|nr:hypothetical protein [Candidatus Desulfatibia profunda]
MQYPNLNAAAVEKFQRFQNEILGRYQTNIHSMAITGSALTADFNPDKSDINSVFVLHKIDLKFLEILSLLGKEHRKKRIGAPLIMTPGYIVNSLDVFPVEFLNIKLLHYTVYGEDLFSELKIIPSDLRLQCEREFKVRLIGLRQGYIAALGDRKMLTEMFFNSIAGYMPLFRAIIFLLGKEPPLTHDDVLATLEAASGVKTTVFKTVLQYKKQPPKLSTEQINTMFEDYYAATEKLGEITNEIQE